MINEKRVEELAGIIKEMNYKPIKFDNPELFPEPDEFIYPNYVFFMVSIDHRTGFDVNWKYRGSDLLFYLARKKQMEVRDFFTAENMIKIDANQIREIFNFQGLVIREPEERAFLLRDCAEKLLEKYEGDVMNLIRSARFHSDAICEKLKEFKAYSDPLRKKSYLFLKILKRQGFGIFGKIWFPVDNVLVKVAINSGIVEPEREILEKIIKKELLGEEEVFKLRKETEIALKMLSEESEIEADIIDDILWTYGRRRGETSLDCRVEKSALERFLKFIETRKLEPNFPHSWFF